VFDDVIVSVMPFPDPVTFALPSTVCSALPIVIPDRFHWPTGHAVVEPDTGGNVTPLGWHAVPMIANAPMQATAMSLRAKTVFMFCLPVSPAAPAHSGAWYLENLTGNPRRNKRLFSTPVVCHTVSHRPSVRGHVSAS
jgi:hypothetical protein